MTFFRWFVGLPMAAIITVGLFFMMAGLIRQDTIEVGDPTPYPDISILPKINPEPRDHRRPTRPDPKLVPPVTDIERTSPTPVPGPRVVPPRTDPPTVPPKKGVIGAPLIKYPPQYPENCRSRAAEGTVTVQFDVTPEGKPVNIRIIESANSCFNRTVRATVAKWKYPPATRGDRAVTRYGVVEVIRFELKD